MEDIDPDHPEIERPPDEEGIIPEDRRIQDFEEWLRANALPAADDDPSRRDVRQEEERALYEEFRAYQDTVHRRIFERRQEEEERQKEERQKQLEAWENDTIDIYTSGRPILDVKLQPLAESCDTVYTLAASWKMFTSEEEKEDSESSSSSQPQMHVSLKDFSKDSVHTFLELVNDRKQIDDLTGEDVVECCQIAHYLQNETILEKTTNILLESIDTANCLSICQLADQLNLGTLFERAMNHIMKSLMDMEENTDIWDGLTAELRDRILAIRAALQSSVNSSQHYSLYFTSLDEYISIFAERVQYYRERLAEAKEQHELQIPYTRAWYDVDLKILRQEERVKTLETVFREQKKMFAKALKNTSRPEKQQRVA